MLAPLALTFITAGVTLGVIVLLKKEEERGVRFCEHVRARFDRSASRVQHWIDEHVPQLDNQFLRQLFHYLTNKVLATFLELIKRVEGFVLRAIQFNKQKAQKARMRHVEGSHWGEIADHKRKSSLSEEEKRIRKEAALNGEG